MKLKKKIIFLCLSLIISLSLSSCNTYTFIIESIKNVFSVEDLSFDNLVGNQKPVVQPEVQISDVLSPIHYENQYGYKSLTSAQKEIYHKINEAVLNYHHFIDLRNTPITFNDFMRIYCYYLDDHPEAFWVYRWIERVYYSDEEEQIIIGVFLQYLSKDGYEQFIDNSNEITQTVSHEELTAMRMEFNEKINEILGGLSVEDDSLMREIKIYNYIAENIRYDHILAEENINETVFRPIALTAYGAAIENATVCSGFSKLFSLLSNYAGIECLTRYGIVDDIYHQWNIICLDGKYYHVDATEPILSGSDQNFISYSYFNITDEKISSTHTIKPYYMTETEVPLSYDTPPCHSNEHNFDVLFGFNISGNSFNRNDFTQKVQQNYKYNISALYFLFPKETDEKIVEKYFHTNVTQIERIAGVYFILEENYYFFFDQDIACIRANRK